MRIRAVRANNHRRAFEIRTARGTYPFPFVLADPRPTAEDRVAEVYADPELGREGFTYVLDSGAEGTLHIDTVLEYNGDPGTMADLTMHRLTVEALERIDRAGLSRRELARRLNTSATQLYRLLDPANYGKSLRQLLALLHVLGCEVDVQIRDRRNRTSA